MSKNEILKNGRMVIEIERNALNDLLERLDEKFVAVVEQLFDTRGRVIVTGMGKSGVIARKLASTLASTGTPSIYLHAAEGIHGDLGMITREDVVIALSHSGETDELVKLLPSFQRLGIVLVAITGHPDSTLGNRADYVLDTSVPEEACPLGLAPTASTTAMLAMGDALAIALLEKRGFDEDDYAMLHPGGSLGNKLLLTVNDLMHTGSAIPLVSDEVTMREALFEITSKGLGVTGVLDENSTLIGVITDGDLRRGLERGNNILDRDVVDIMTEKPKWITRDALAQKALHVMEEFSITQLFVFKSQPEGDPIGIIHIHDILRSGIA
ncbi:MAG: KpsF/GutQ family sugar-phosphate isomerase [Candidatus Marinimicrobia bacterium]|nr:KpsF/GutQ family sugar-phosphate isomerase [Candidatus Neomarinimicrobiota bacterium]MCF7829509.1 KpsF/GutQ family sugar-phosphate isomerase [Candidatus Neomarinimicrobiota bacterium]MCF7880093.1 KpsF/GutQ family sugar-phosphate isomerase [Candidatus Neomarinimicrobiota bacterium]